MTQGTVPLGLEPRTCGLRDLFRSCWAVPANALTCGFVRVFVRPVAPIYHGCLSPG
jgi:hypothetical protein